jgi:hypothetical protein
MPEYNFTFRGWKAIAALAVTVAIFGVRTLLRFQTVDDGARTALEAWLLKDYQGHGPREIMKRLEDYKEGLPVQPLPEIKPMNIEFPSLSALGSSGNMVVKAKITVDSGPPPGGDSVRYFYLMRSIDGAWFVSSETDAYSYYRVLLP